MYIFTHNYIHILILDSGLPKFFPANSVSKAHKPQKLYLGYDGMTGDSLGWLGLCKPLIQCDFRKNMEQLPNCNLLPNLVQKAIWAWRNPLHLTIEYLNTLSRMEVSQMPEEAFGKTMVKHGKTLTLQETITYPTKRESRKIIYPQKRQLGGDTVDGSEILHQLRLVVYLIIYMDFFHQQYVSSQQGKTFNPIIFTTFSFAAPRWRRFCAHMGRGPAPKRYLWLKTTGGFP